MVMSAAIYTLPPAKLSRRMPVSEITPFEQFELAKRLSAPATERFLLYVERAGGGFYTDLATMRLLFELWKEKGRP